MKRNILLEEIARKTNINEKILIALENNEYRQIPGKFYVNNFIKSYLKAIDIDEKHFFRNHREAIELVIKHQEAELPVFYNKIRYSRFKRKKLFLGIVILGIACMMLTMLVIENRDQIFNFFSRQPQKDIIPETGLVLDMENQDMKPDFSPIQVEIESLADCWIQIYRGKQKYVERILKRGERERISGYELLITIGDPASVNLTINEKEISQYKNSSRPLKLYLTPQNLQVN